MKILVIGEDESNALTNIQKHFINVDCSGMTFDDYLIEFALNKDNNVIYYNTFIDDYMNYNNDDLTILLHLLSHTGCVTYDFVNDGSADIAAFFMPVKRFKKIESEEN